MSNARRLITLYATGTLPGELWSQFMTKTAAAGYGPTGALARLMRRYLARGFDDGQAEQASTPPPAATAASQD